MSSCPISDTLIVSMEFNPNEDAAILIIARPNEKDEKFDIVNAFAGQDALDLYDSMLTKKEMKKEKV